jgi:sugar lactone lactonase YvrE
VTRARAPFAAALALAASAASGADARAPHDAVAAYLAAWNGTQPIAAGLLSDDFVDRTTLLPLDASMFGHQLAAWRDAVPDLRVSLVERASAPGREVLRLRYEGSVRDAAGLVPLSGGRIAIEQTEWLTVAAGRIGSRHAYLDEWTLPSEWMFVAPPSAPLEPYAATTIAELESGRFLESVAIAPDGRLYVSTGHDGGISIVAPDGRVQPYARVDVGPGGLMMCLALDRTGALLATVNSGNDAVRGVWRFDATGRGDRVAALPPGSVPNGIAVDGRGNAFVADSFGGVIWKVAAGSGTAQVWLRHAWLTPRPLVGRYPGANGLQIAKDAVYVAVSDRSLLLRIPFAANGDAAGPEIYASGLPGDDFAVAADGTLYVTTHPFDSVVRLSPDGRRVVVAGPAQGVIGPTAAALGEDGALYIVTDGGLFRPLPGQTPVPAVVRLTQPRR